MRTLSLYLDLRFIDTEPHQDKLSTDNLKAFILEVTVEDLIFDHSLMPSGASEYGEYASD